jgi:membrane associated rhomboid family serine protease
VADLRSLRWTGAGAFVRRLWGLAVKDAASSTRECPGCGAGMAEVPTIAAPGSPGAVRLDVCRSCQLVWFDPQEYDAWLKAPLDAAGVAHLPQETRWALAKARLDQPREAAFSEAPDEDLGWLKLLCLLGVPVEIDAPKLRSPPWITWTLAAILILSFFAFGRQDGVVRAWGMVPAELWRHGGLTLLTSFFLHADVAHVFGNLYYLMVFGDNVEDILGSAPYLLLIALAALAGDLFHAAAFSSSTIPAIGASGGISGVIAFYAVRFPRGRLRMWRYGWFDLRVSTAVTFWLALQLIGAAVQVAAHGAPGIGYLCHLGGAAVGALFWRLSR